MKTIEIIFKAVLAILIIATITLSSCGNRNGYGCHGNSKIITRVK